ncbi:MAG: tRNA (adenosine(37)-N6)-threonylcarbamoyltransferase complex dimerization subunit type 1 TsaB [Nitrospinaceae bacterium]
MKILGIDSSTPQGSVALIENQNIVSQASLEKSSTYSNRLLALVDQVLADAHWEWSDVDGFSVTTGPGSFTGLRVGVSLVKGFVLHTGKPFRGIDTLEAISACAEPTPHPICPILDARKKEIYTAFFKYEENRLDRISPDCAIAPEELCGRISGPTVFLGSGLDPYGGFFSARLGPRFVHPPPRMSIAAAAALLAHPRFDDGAEVDLDDLRITYVRKSEAELNFSKST